MKKIILVFIVMSLLSAAAVLTGCDSDKNGKKLVLNEVMTKNDSVIADGDGEYSDWVELYNGTDKDINIKGYYLSNNMRNPAKWEFPDITIKAGEYLVVFVSGKDKVEDNGYTCHTNFKLSAGGDVVILSSNAVSSIDSMDIPELPADVSYGRVQDGSEDEGKPFRLLSASPGGKNSGKRSDDDITPSEGNNSGIIPENLTGTGEILINEYMSRNSYACYDEDGDYSDWIELYNTKDTAVNLSGYSLTTELTNIKKWSFPNVTIEAKSYLLVWISGKNKLTGKGEVHASFKLGADDPILVLSSADGRVVDYSRLEHLPGNISQGRSASETDKWVYFSKPTPGKPNTSTEFDNLSMAASLSARGLWTSEVSSANVPYNDKQVSDWIEIYNGTGKAVSLNGYGLSIDLKNKYMYKFGDKSIGPGEYLVVYAPGINVPEKYASKLHTNFKLDSKGETIYLTDNEGYIIDAYETGRLSLGYTSGRAGNGDAVRYFFKESTLGKANASDKYISYTAKPEISNEGGYVGAGTAVSLKAPEGAAIYYTTDGSEPGTGSKKYTGEITVSSNTVIKAKAVMDGMLPSDTVTATYIVGKKHSVPVVSISIKPDDFSGHNNGIYANGPGYAEPFPYVNANFWKDWERKMTFEYYNADGVKQLELDAGLKVFGQYSQTYNQKSMSVHFRDGYGIGKISYPFFKDNKVTSMESLVIRAGGQDYKQTIIKDPFAGQVMKGQSSLVFMDWQPVALYINGEYFGFYCLREKINESYLETHLGIDSKNVDIIKGNTIVLAGTYDNYKALMDYIKTHDLSKSEYYNVVENWVDIDNYIDYLITEIFFANGDTGNVKFYRERKDGAKWQWVMFDFDMTLRNDIPDTISKLFNPAGHGTGNLFSTRLQCALLKNETFRNKFVERYAYHLNNTFKADRMINILDGMVGQMKDEVQPQIEKWGHFDSYNSWAAYVNRLKENINGRRKIAVNELYKCKYFNVPDAKMAELFSDWAQIKK